MHTVLVVVAVVVAVVGVCFVLTSPDAPEPGYSAKIGTLAMVVGALGFVLLQGYLG